MAYGQAATFGDVSFARERAPRHGFLWVLPWGGALALAACLALHTRPAAAPVFVAAQPIRAATPVRARAAANPYGDLVGLTASFANPYGELVAIAPEPAPASPKPPPALTASLETVPEAVVAVPQPSEIPLPPKRDVAALDTASPAPPPRPAEFGSLVAPVSPPDTRIARRTPPSDDRNAPAAVPGQGDGPGLTVAYAAPEDRVAAEKGPSLAAIDRATGFSTFARSPSLQAYGELTAVYDISARAVYLPDGTRLEAHSGLGDRLDDPRFVSERDRGATPPHVYELEPRQELFHGVQALRLNPIGDGDLFGRTGLLAHTYMLGPNGDSNGCVSFKDYDAFLRAFQQGRVKRLVVVARLD